MKIDKTSDETKRTIDEKSQEIGLSFEELRVDKEIKEMKRESSFLIKDISEDDIGMFDLENNMPIIVENNEVFRENNLAEGDKIRAQIYSKVDENGMTSEWHFKEIKKI